MNPITNIERGLLKSYLKYSQHGNCPGRQCYIKASTARHFPLLRVDGYVM